MPAPKTIRILTYNAAMVPGSSSDARAKRIVAAILAATPRFDVVCMQEVFEDGARAVFKKRLAPSFPHLDTISGSSSPFNQDSGLFFASRFPIVAKSFVEFADAAPVDVFGGMFDALADKGVFGALLDLSPDFPKKELYVFNTHLQSSRPFHDVRAKQLTQIRKVIARSLVKRPAAALLCGDFNVIAESAAFHPTTEYQNTLARLGWPRDLFREALPNAAGFTWDAPKNPMIPKDDEQQERLDYVLAFDNRPVVDDAAPRVPIPLVFSKAVELALVAKNLSDHFGVSATVSFSSKI